MARTKTDDLLIAALGTRRSQLAQDIATFDASGLAKLQAELSEVEQRLKAIDPTIPSLAEEAQALADQKKAEAAALENVGISSLKGGIGE